MDYSVQIFIRLYYYRKGSFKGIESANFYPLVLDCYRDNDMGFSNFQDYLYASLGYNNNALYTPKEVAEHRKEFSEKSYSDDYLKVLQDRYKCKDYSELIDVLDSYGILGLHNRHLSDLGNYTNLGIPSDQLTTKIMPLCLVVSSFLDKTNFNAELTLKNVRQFLLPKGAKDVAKYFEEWNVDSISPIKVKYDNRFKKPKVLDGVLYTSKINDLDEKELSALLLKLYLLGFPFIIAKIKDAFSNSLGRCLFGKDSYHVLTMIDIANIMKTTVNKLLNVYGIAVPDPEFMWLKFGGVVNIVDENVVYSRPGIEEPTILKWDEFLRLKNLKKI